MATGNNYLTTYYAKRIIGDDASAAASSALLETGSRTVESGETIDTWIFHDTNLNTTYGIKHENGTNKYLKIYGNSVVGWYINMDTGDIYVLGKVGIGYDPETSGNSYKLYVNGTSYFANAVRIQYTTPNLYICDTQTAADTYAIIRFGNKDTANGAYIFLNGPDRTGDGGQNMMTIRNNVGDLRLNNNTTITGTLYLSRTTDAEGTTDNRPALIIGDVTGTHLEFDGNEIMAKASATTTNTLYINNNGGHTSFGGSIYSSDIRGGNVRLTSNWVGFYASSNAGGNRYGYIQANADRMYYRKENGVSTYHHDFNGHIYASSTIHAGGHVKALGGYLYSTANSNTVTIGSQNTSYCHIQNSANIPFYFNKTVNIDGTMQIYNTAAMHDKNQCKVTNTNGTIGIYSSTNRGLYEYTDGKWIVYLQHSDDTVRFGYNAYVYSSTYAGNADKGYTTGSSSTQYLVGVPAYSSTYQTHYIYSPVYMSSGTLYAYNVKATSGYLYATANSNTIQIGAQNSGCCHIYNSANIPFAFNRGFLMVNSGDIGSSSYPTGNIIVKSSGRVSGNGGHLYLGNSNNAGWVFVQDMASQNGSSYWALHQAGNAEFSGQVQAGTLRSTSYAYLNGTVYVNTNVWGWSGGAHLEVNTNGQVAIWTVGNYRAVVQNDGSFVLYNSSNRAIWYTGTSSTYLIKTNIRPITNDTFIRFRRLNVVSFRYKPEIEMEDTSEQYGLIAEEVLPIFPNLVRVPENYNPANFSLSKKYNQPMLQVKYDKLIPLLVKIVQLQWDEIDQLKNQIQQLTNRLSTI